MISFIRNKLNLRSFRKKWRKINKHNMTIPSSVFPIEKVKVGKMSYGILNVKTFGNQDEELSIGNFVSIAEDVRFILGGNHRIDTLSNYPIYSKYISNSPQHDALTKGPIIIEDDVWIGTNSIILSGLTISKGTIVAAGSVVTKSTFPYSIVGGNPAKLIRMRFNESIINSLLEFNFSLLNEVNIKSSMPLLYETLNENSLNTLMSIR